MNAKENYLTRSSYTDLLEMYLMDFPKKLAIFGN